MNQGQTGNQLTLSPRLQTPHLRFDLIVIIRWNRERRVIGNMIGMIALNLFGPIHFFFVRNLGLMLVLLSWRNICPGEKSL